MKRILILWLMFWCVGAFFCACTSPPLEGPPTLRLGRDECSHCGMSITEDRCSCAILVEDASGRAYRIFDDLGCLLHFRANDPQTAVLGVFVHDYQTKAWVDGSAARYLIADRNKLSTPMGSGMVAFATAQTADAHRQAFGGETTDYAGLAEAWRRRREAQLNKPH